MRRHAVVLALAALAALAAVACHDTDPMKRITAVRDGALKDDAASIAQAGADVPACPDLPPVALGPLEPSPREKTCLGEMANALGSKKGFSSSPPDQASAAAAALVILRDKRGDWLARADAWLGSEKTGAGAGVDALRLAVADAMAAAAPTVGRKIDEPDIPAVLKAIAQAIPGACPTYWMIGSGNDPSTLPAEMSPDHAACVQHDMTRREGLGASYGFGLWRAVEGGLAVWRETERALRIGAAKASPEAKAAIEAKLAVIEPATQKIETKKMAAVEPPALIEYLGDVHAEAGYVLFKKKDAGPDADAGAPAAPAPMRR